MCAEHLVSVTVSLTSLLSTSLPFLIIPISPHCTPISLPSRLQDFYFTGVPANFSEYDMQYWQFVDASSLIVSTALGLTPMDKYIFNRYVLYSVLTLPR